MANSNNTPEGSSSSNSNSTLTAKEFVTGARQHMLSLNKDVYSLICCYQIYHHAVEKIINQPDALTEETRHGLKTLQHWLHGQSQTVVSKSTAAVNWVEDHDVAT